MSEQNYMSTRAANATIDELREELTAAQQRVAELNGALKRQTEKLLEERGRVMDLTAQNARLQTAIRELIKTLRINCPHGNAVADCYDIPTYTGE